VFDKAKNEAEAKTYEAKTEATNFGSVAIIGLEDLTSQKGRCSR